MGAKRQHDVRATFLDLRDLACICDELYGQDQTYRIGERCAAFRAQLFNMYNHLYQKEETRNERMWIRVVVHRKTSHEMHLRKYTLAA